MDAAVRRNEGKLCFIKRKSRELVSNCRIFLEKNVSFFEDRERLNKNLWTFFRNAPSFSSSSPLFWKRRPSLRPRVTHCFLIRTALRANGHAPAHRALSEFEILAFTLHLPPQFADTVHVVREGNTLFLPSPVKAKGVKPSPAIRCF